MRKYNMQFSWYIPNQKCEIHEKTQVQNNGRKDATCEEVYLNCLASSPY